MDSLAESVRSLSTQFIPLMMAVVFHEYGHGLVANKWGDSTAKEQGRLTLNPVPHIDLLGTIIFPILSMLGGTGVLFGWAKPVPIDPRRFRKFRPGLFWVSFAGPLTNVVLAILSAAVLCSILVWVEPSFYLFEPLTEMARFSVVINFALAIFNLLPLPPLDGSKIVESFLSYNAAMKYESIARYSFFILLALIFSGALRILSVPILFLANATLLGMGTLFGITGA